MPELPEVETVCRTLRPHVVGRRIDRVRVVERRLRRPVAEDFERQLEGRTIRGVRRRAKYVLFDVGEGVVIGHAAVVHGCTIEDGALIGIGARVLDGAVVEEGAQIGAGAVVPPGMVVPAGQLVLGIPARVKRPLTAEESADILEIRDRYIELKEEYRSQQAVDI